MKNNKSNTVGFVNLAGRGLCVFGAFLCFGNVNAITKVKLVGIAKIRKTLFGLQIAANQVPSKRAIIGPILCIA